MGWREEQDAMVKALNDELDGIVAKSTEAELAARFLKNFGCINFKSDEYMHEVYLARTYHHRLEKLHPEMHDCHDEYPYRCYCKTVCKCGYSEACDSSD